MNLLPLPRRGVGGDLAKHEDLERRLGQAHAANIRLQTSCHALEIENARLRAERDDAIQLLAVAYEHGQHDQAARNVA